MQSIIRTYLENYRLSIQNVYHLHSQIINELDIKNYCERVATDTNKVAQITEYIQKSHLVDGIIQLAYIKGEGLICYDGIHRLAALRNIADVVSVSVSAIIRILWDANDDMIDTELIRIDKDKDKYKNLIRLEKEKNLKGILTTAKPKYTRKLSDELCTFMCLPKGSESDYEAIREYLDKYIADNKLQNEKNFVRIDYYLKNLIKNEKIIFSGTAYNSDMINHIINNQSTIINNI